MPIKTMKAILSILMLLCIFTTRVFAADQPRITFSVKALFKDYAMLEINGEQHILSAGEESPQGIKLISSDAHEANIFCHGEEFTLYINQTAYVEIADKENPSKYSIPSKIVPGSTVAYNKESLDGVIRYELNSEYAAPTAIEYGQDAIWIGVDRKLLRFDLGKEAWGLFDLSGDLNYLINKLSVSDKSVILNASKRKNDKSYPGLYLFDTRTGQLHQQLDSNPNAYQFIGETLWFLDSTRGLGYIDPRKNNPDIGYNDALLYKEKPKVKNEAGSGDSNKKVKNEMAYMLAANGDDIWYSHYSGFAADDWSHRLNEVCVSRYNKKNKTFIRYTRKEMALDSKINCSYLAVSDDQVWVSHDNRDAGLSVFDTATKTWRNILTSTNNMLVGGRKIMLDDGNLLMFGNNQLIGLDTETLYARVILGDAVIKNQWQSVFYAKGGYAWFATKETSSKNSRKSNLVLYRVPIDPGRAVADLD